MAHSSLINWRASGYGPKDVRVGTPGVGVTAEHFTTDGYNFVTKLEVAGVLPAIAGGAALGVGLLAYTWPAGVHIVEATRMSLALQQTEGNVTADTPEISLGSVIVVGAVATMTTSTWEDLQTAGVTADCDGTTEENTTLTTGGHFISQAAGSKSIFINVADTWAASGDVALGVAGDIWISWQAMSAT